MLDYCVDQEGEESRRENTASRYGESYIYFGKIDGSEGQWYDAKDKREKTVSVNGTDTTFTISVGNNVCIKAYTKDVDIDPSDITVEAKQQIAKGDTRSLKAKVYPTYANDKTLTYASSNEAVVTVDDAGNVTGVANGTATITITQPKMSLTKEVEVTVYTNPTSLSFATEQLSLNVGDRVKMPSLKREPMESWNAPVAYKIDDEEVAALEDGELVAKKNGEATLTASTSNGVKATCKIVVTTKTTGIEVEQEAYTVSSGKTVQLKANVLPKTASNQELSYRSLNEKIASVNEKGLVVGKEDGTCTIQIFQGSITKEVTITVLPVARSIAFSERKVYELEVNGTNTAQLPEVIFDPVSATSKEITYHSSNEEVATVDESGKVTAVGEGQAKLTATFDTGEEVLTTTNVCEVKVTIKTEAIEVNEESYVMNEGDDGYLGARVVPENATNQSLTYTSSNEKVVTVSEDGDLLAKNAGSATITIRQGDLVKEVQVTVIQKVKNFIIEGYRTLQEGNYTMIDRSITPQEKASEIKWKSSNPSIATVDDDGYVEAMKCGTAKIIASVDDWISTCEVTVIPKTPMLKSVKATAYNKVQLSFSKNQTEIYRATSKNGSYQKIATVNASTYTDTVKTGQTYYYKIRVIKNGMYSKDSNVLSVKTSLTTPSIAKMTNKDGSVKVEWKKIAGATSYEVYRATSKNGKYTRMKVLKTTSYTDNQTVGGKTYYYKVRGVGSDVKSAFSTSKSTVATLKKVSLLAKKKTLTWKKISGAKGYEVYASKYKTKAFKKVATTTKTSYKAKTSYYKVRAYYLQGKKKVYGSFSTVKKV